MKSSSPTHLPSLLGSLLFILGSTLLFGVALVAGTAAMVAYVTDQRVDIPSIIFSFTYGFEGLIVGIIAFFVIQKFLQNKNADQSSSVTLTGMKIILGGIGAALAIVIGSKAADHESINWLILPILTIPAVALPIWLLFSVGVQKLALGSRWQTMSVLGISMTLAPFILIILETALILIFVIGVIVYIGLQPELAQELQRLANQMTRMEPGSPAMLRLLTPYFSKPGVILLLLSYFSLFVPMIEELVKPLGVWLFGARIDSIAQGFALGALSGAGYALVETFGVSGQVDEWASLLTTRIGTGMLHITTSALMGGGIIAMWHHRRYLYGFAIYLLAILLHGLWNMAAVTYSLSSSGVLPSHTINIHLLESGALAGMQILTAIFLGTLFFNNRKYRKALIPTAEIPAPPPADIQDKTTP